MNLQTTLNRMEESSIFWKYWKRQKKKKKKKFLPWWPVNISSIHYVDRRLANNIPEKCGRQ